MGALIGSGCKRVEVRTMDCKRSSAPPPAIQGAIQTSAAKVERGCRPALMFSPITPPPVGTSAIRAEEQMRTPAASSVPTSGRAAEM